MISENSTSLLAMTINQIKTGIIRKQELWFIWISL